MDDYPETALLDLIGVFVITIAYSGFGVWAASFAIP